LECVSSASFSVRVNGESFGLFKVEEGLGTSTLGFIKLRSSNFVPKLNLKLLMTESPLLLDSC